MEYNVNINGIEVNAKYSDENIRDIFVPVLEKAKNLYEKNEKRVVVLLAAPPGSGKSTLLSFLKYLSETNEELMPITTIGMDGFHRYQDYLISHSLTRDGKEYKMVEVKGCPETFDLEKLTERLKRISNGENIGWPEYNRMTHNPEEDAILVDGNIVFLEGNYLLLNRKGWKDLKKYADFTISIKASESLLKGRLVDRKVKSGTTLDNAKKFVEFSDMYNVRTCLTESVDADVELEILDDGSYDFYKELEKNADIK
ncbi:MAG: nucleoside/nucleotide kinase family protein [Pseudobutyrivibrio sp.]|nr:nucleoside/nucleotide kinase family protein [Pseudobutyrivibrio sp.]